MGYRKGDDIAKRTPARDVSVLVRVTAAERDAWRAGAAVEGLTVSEWLRTAAADRRAEKPDQFGTSHRLCLHVPDHGYAMLRDAVKRAGGGERDLESVAWALLYERLFETR